MNVDFGAIRPPEAATMARQLGIGRAVLAGASLVAPAAAVRLVGTDTATARRVSWLTRMMAVRDGAIAVGALAAGRRDAAAAAPWLLAGAVSDAVDTAVIAGAIRDGRLRGVVAALVPPLGVGVACLGVLTAVRLRRS